MTCFKILKIVMVLTFLLPLSIKAQTVKTQLDSNFVEFSNPVKYSISVTVKSGQKVYFPQFKNNKIGEYLEVLTTLKPDTHVTVQKEVTFTHSFLITSFKDSALYVPALPIRIDKDTVWTDSLKITFTLLQGIDSTFTAEIDTTKTLKVFDIKPVKETPWTFAEFWARYSRLILILLVVALIASIATYMYIRWKNNKPIIPILKPKEPAEKVAMRKLLELKDKKLCQQGLSKEFYTQLTEILKTYISDRYDQSVLESTSDETLKTLDGILDKKSQEYSFVKYILGVADFVKFAKLEPLQDENDNSMSYAIKFVEMTKKVVEEAPESGDNKLEKNV